MTEHSALGGTAKKAVDRRSRKSTAWDVAELAGVSQATVSRVFTGATHISGPTRELVLQAAGMLKYLPDKRASRLRSGQTGVIAVVVITRPEDSVREVNPVAYALLGSVCRAASQRGYGTLVSFQARKSEFYSQYIGQSEADAMIVLGTTQNPDAWEHFRPILQDNDHAICWGLPMDEAQSVRSDNCSGGRMAAEHLWKMGYRKSVFIGPINSAQCQFNERYEGFRDAFNELGGTFAAISDLGSTGRIEQGKRAIERLRQDRVDFDSIFAACDFLALGALEALVSFGINVPDDVGIIGYDGLTVTAHTSPPLTTIKPDLEKAGRQLVARALNRNEESTSQLAPVEIVIRKSTQRIPSE